MMNKMTIISNFMFSSLMAKLLDDYQVFLQNLLHRSLLHPKPEKVTLHCFKILKNIMHIEKV